MSEIINNPTATDNYGDYWESRWQEQATGWDIGYPSPVITKFVDTIQDKNISILIPGCGNAYEAEYLLKNGFQNITLIDISAKAVEILKNKFVNDPQIKVVLGDFFQHIEQYDLMLEQTFFCAIPPSKRADYVKKAAELLSPKGKIVGVLYDTVFEKQGPPFGGSKEEYQALFENDFNIEKMEICYNSIPQRQGNEVFINFQVQ